jgi:hypothetical protein
MATTQCIRVLQFLHGRTVGFLAGRVRTGSLAGSVMLLATARVMALTLAGLLVAMVVADVP